MSRIQLEKKRGSKGTDREREKKRERECGGGGESREHVNRYMFETHRVFILAVMHRQDGRGDGERNVVSDDT